jgi:hypothetical protein
MCEVMRYVCSLRNNEKIIDVMFTFINEHLILQLGSPVIVSSSLCLNCINVPKLKLCYINNHQQTSPHQRMKLKPWQTGTASVQLPFVQTSVRNDPPAAKLSPVGQEYNATVP